MPYNEPTYGETGEVYTDNVRNSLAHVKSAAEAAQAGVDNLTASVSTTAQTADEAKEIAEAAKAFVESPTDARVAGLVNDSASATNAALSASYGRVVLPSGDTTGVADRTAINAALLDGPVVLRGGDYYIDAPLTSGASTLILHGDDKNTTTLRAVAGFTGYMLTPEQGFHVSDLTLRGSGIDGCYGFGAEAGTRGGTIAKRLKFYACEYGVRFEGSAEFPLGATWEDIYCYDFRTAGISIATGGTPQSGQTATPASGQSAWSFDGIVCTNGGAAVGRSLPAAGFSQADDTTATSDTVSWSGTDATEFGYRVMRRPVGSTDTDSWQWVATVEKGTTSYVASKSAGVYYTYAVVRNSTAVYLRHGKAVSIGTIQGEYCGEGVRLRDIVGCKIGAVYQEWRGNDLTNPTPRGNAVVTDLCRGVEIGAGWADRSVSAVSTRDTQLNIGVVRANDCQRSAVHVTSTAATYPVSLDGAWVSGSTPAVISTSGSAFDWNLAGRNIGATDLSVANREQVDHVTLAEFEARFRGARKAALGADGSGGYEWLVSAALPTAGAAYEGQVRRTSGKLYICFNDGSEYAWVPFVKATTVSNSQVTIAAGARTDGSAVGSFGYDGAGQPTANPSASTKDFVVLQGGVRQGVAGPMWRSGAGTPEGVLTAPVGSLYTRTDGGAATTLYVKESGTGNTGWVAK